MQSRANVIRVVPELRAVHLERQRVGVPAEVLYFGAKYDLDDSLPGAVGDAVDGSRFTRVTRFEALRQMITTSATRLEVFEPLWIRLWPTHFALVVAFRLAGLLRRRHREIGTYAMENSSLATLVGGDRTPPRILVSGIGLPIGLTARLSLTRIAFASEASADVYRRLPFVEGIPRRVGLELPSAGPGQPGSPLSVVFLGVLDERKGVRLLLEAWELVESRVAGARLTVIGGGPLGDVVDAWVRASPQTRNARGSLPRDEATEIVGRSSVLVAPSVPNGRWREQIGLPIKEGLAAGLTIVTTDQTGLAGWLSAHGHGVLPVDAGASLPGHLEEALAERLVAALRSPLDRELVRASLPKRDGRLDADAWLNA